MYDDPGGDRDYTVDHDDVSGTGLLGATLRNAGIVIAMGLGIAWVMGGLGFDENGPSRSAGAVPAASGEGPSEYERDEDETGQRVAYATDEIVVPPGPQGHFVVTLDVNGTPVRFLVDTGATMVTLTAEDARRIGLPVRALDYNLRSNTANGVIGVAAVTLRDIQLGNLEIRDVQATVTQAQLNISLLGMSFLRRLSSFEVVPRGLILRF